MVSLESHGPYGESIDLCPKSKSDILETTFVSRRKRIDRYLCLGLAGSWARSPRDEAVSFPRTLPPRSRHLCSSTQAGAPRLRAAALVLREGSEAARFPRGILREQTGTGLFSKTIERAQTKVRVWLSPEDLSDIS